MKLIKFEKKMCPKCDMVQAYLDDAGAKVEHIDVENSSDIGFISKYVEMSLPVVVLLNENEELIEKSIGFVPEELEAIIYKLNLNPKGDTNMTKLIGLDYAKNQVKEFQAAFNHPVSEKPTSMKLDRGVSRAIWTGEEALVEFVHQSSSNEEEFLNSYDKLITGLEKAKQKSLGLEYPKNEIEKIIGQSDALTDAAYFVLGSFVEMGVDPQPLLDIVQQANMAKLGADGKPIIRESDGKIMKPEGWEPPEAKLEVEIKRQVGK